MNKMLALVALSGLMVGCVSSPHKMYEGADAKPAEVATVTWMYSQGEGYMGVRVDKVNGKEVPRFTNSNVMHLLPGSHTFDVECRPGGHKGSGTFSLEAGKSYILRGRDYKSHRLLGSDFTCKPELFTRGR